MAARRRRLSSMCAFAKYHRWVNEGTLLILSMFI
jgi:hypothetical protein